MSARLFLLGVFLLALGLGILCGAELASDRLRGGAWGAVVYGAIQLGVAAVLRWRERARRRDAVVLDVGRLDERGVAAMVGDMLAQRYVPASFAAFLTARSEGNPYFVVEYVRTAVADGLLRRTEAGGWRIPEGEGAWEKLALPTSLAELVLRRLGGLSGEARAVVAAASVVGRTVPAGVLASVMGLAEEGLLGVVRELILRQVLEDAGGGELRFVHDKIREAAYDALTGEERRALHAAVGAAIEGAGGGEDPGWFAALAHHFTEAGDAARAMTYLERAGEHALATFASREAAGFFRELCALDDRTRVGAPTPEETLRRVRWERSLSEASFGAGDVNGMLEHAERALKWAGVEPPTSTRGWVASLARNVPLQVAHRLMPERFVARDETERAIAREASAAMQRLAQRSYFLDANAMIAGSLWSVNLAERAGGAPQVALSYAMLGMVAGIARLRGPAQRYLGLARGSAREHGFASGLVDTDYAEATWRSGSAEWGDVYRLLDAALERAHRLGDHNQEDIVRTVLANTDFFTGRFTRSRERLDEVTRNARRRENPQLLAWGLYGAARAMIPLGEVRAAAVLLEEGALVLAPQAELPSKILCHALLAVARLGLGDRAGALAAARDALRFIFENRLAAYAIVAGCADTADVLSALAPAFPEARGGARDVAGAMGWLALSMPLAGPYLERVKARAALEEGAKGRAARATERALAGAKRLGLPYEEARAHLGLARLAGATSAEGRRHRLAGERLLISLDCPPGSLEASLDPAQELAS